MPWGQRIAGYWEAFLRLLYPSTCGVCRKGLALDESVLCRDCRKKLETQKRPPHKRPLHGRWRALDEAWALYSYEPPVRDLLTAVKFARERWNLELFYAELGLWAAVLHAENTYSAVIPIPMERMRLVHRQFNQAALLAKAVSRFSHIPVKMGLLKKRRRTLVQSRLSRAQRLHNLDRTFKAGPEQAIRGKCFLLVDDILTTGSTANAAAQTLKRKGALKVDILSVAYTERRA